MYTIGGIIGSLLATYIFTRFFYFIQNKFFSEIKKLNKIIFSYILFLSFSTILGGYGFARGGEPVFVQAFLQYLPAAVIFLLFDFYRLNSSSEQSQKLDSEVVQIQNSSNATANGKNFCSTCGEKLQDSAKFCSSCGTVI